MTTGIDGKSTVFASKLVCFPVCFPFNKDLQGIFALILNLVFKRGVPVLQLFPVLYRQAGLVIQGRTLEGDTASILKSRRHGHD